MPSSTLTRADAAALVTDLDRRARRIETPCGDGNMVWRAWGEGPAVVLLHGGHGAWSHWVRNVLPLSAHHTVIAADMPGFADSAAPPAPYTAESMAEIMGQGLDLLLDRDLRQEKAAIVGFSFGGVIGGVLARARPARTSRLIIVGSGGMGLPRPRIDTLQNWKRMDDEAARLAAHRNNLEVLMLADPANVDPLALYLQSTNTVRTRINSRAISLTDVLRRSLAVLDSPLDGIWGTRDATVGEYMDLRETALKSFDSGASLIRIEGGHWIQYEAAEAFNAALLGLLAKPRTRRGE